MLKIFLGLGMTALGGGLIWFGGNFAAEGWGAFRNSSVTGASLDIKIGLNGEMQIYNRGREVSDINIFVTKYTLDEELYGRGKITLKHYNRPSGALKTISKLKHDKKTLINLASLPTIEFAENPGEKINNKSARLIYYGVRVTYVSLNANSKHFQYHALSAVKTYPDYLSDAETTAGAGPVSSNLANFSELRNDIINHMKTMYADP